MPLRAVSRGDVGVACLLAFLAGAVDAIGFSLLDGTFVSFMSGNTTRLGLSLVAGRWTAASTIFGVVAAFVAGAAIGTVVGTVWPRRRRAALLGGEAAALLLAGVLGEAAWRGGAAMAMALAMGMENEVLADRSGKTGISLTFVSGTLVKLGEGVGRMIFEGLGWGWARFLALWMALLAGVVTGGLAYVAVGVPTLFGLGVLFLVLAVGFAAAEERETARR